MITTSINQLRPAPLKDSEPTTIDPEIMAKAREFESVFVAQMLSHSGLSKALSQGGDYGSEAFSTMLLENMQKK